MSFSLILRCCRKNIPFIYKTNLRPSTSIINGNISVRFVSLEKKERHFVTYEKKLMVKDKVPEGYTLIYKSDNLRYVAVGMAVMLVGSTLIFISAINGYFSGGFAEASEHKHKYSRHLKTDTGKDIYKLGYVLFILLAIATIVCIRMMLRIYNKGDSYIGFYQGYLPWTTRRLDFKLGDAQIKDQTWHWRLSDFKIKDRKTILDEDMFRTPSDCHKMLGGYIKQDDDDQKGIFD